MRGHGIARWVGAVLVGGLALTALTACEGQQHLRLTVTTTADGLDANPGDGTCEATVGAGDCTLRASFDEASASSDPVDIAVPAGTYVLSVTGGSPATILPLHLASNEPIHVLSRDAGAIVDADGGPVAIEIGHASADLVGITATGASSAGYVVTDTGALTMFGSYATGNDRDGIQVGPGSSAQLSYSQLTNNGGAGATSSGRLELTHSLVSGNQDSGLFLVDGTATVLDSAITANASTFTGGGIDVGGQFGSAPVGLEIRRSLIDHNTADLGSALFVNAGTTTIDDTTLSDNTGAGTVVVGNSYPHTYSEGHVEVSRSTIADNPGNATGATLDLQAGTMSVRGSIVDDASQSCSGAVVSLGYNLDSTGGCGFAATGDIAAVDPQILPLAFNGGLLRSRMPAIGSPVVDAIPSGTVGLCDGSSPLDQRGAPRPVSGPCDIGAVEGTSMTPLVPLDLRVDTAADGRDLVPGDGVCATVAGGCSLRAAIDETNAWHGTDEITVASGIDPVLSIPGADEDANATGDLDITDTVIIHGNGRSLDAAHLDRAIDIVDGVRSEVHDLEIHGGSTSGDGGGVRSQPAGGINPATRLVGLYVHDNVATRGGGIAVPGSSAIASSDITDNDASVGGGGGVMSSGTLTIDTTTIARNTGGRGGGVLLPTSSGSIRVTLSQITDNHATKGEGGGVSVGIGEGLIPTSGTFVADRSEISGNTVSGGAIGQYGGGVFQNGGSVSLLQSTVATNSTGTSVTVSHGGGVAVLTGTTEIDSSTVSSNSSGADAGGVWISQSVGVSTVTITRSTIAANTAPQSSAIEGTATVAATAIAGIGAPACHGAITSGGFSMANDASCGLPVGTVDLGLGLLGANGGTTRTHLPSVGSPLVDVIPPGTPLYCDDTVLADQRGIARLIGEGCDIGSVER